MRKVYQLHVLVLSVLISVSAKLSAASYTWNGSVSEEWSTSSNWSPAGVPDLLDDVIINGSGAFQPEWEELPGIRNLTISGGTLNLAIFFMPVYGTCNFTGGTVTGGTLVISAANAVFAGTTFNCNVNYTGANPQLNGSVFFGNVSLTKVGGVTVNCAGGNVFHGNVGIINQSTNQFRFETSLADVFNGNLSLNNVSSGGIFMAFSALGTSFNGNIEVNSNGNTGVFFGANGGTSSLATGKKLSIGANGFTAGNLRFAGFSQSGNNRFEFNGSGSSRIFFEPGTIFDAVLKFNFPLFYLNGATFNDSLIINKTINGSCTSNGGNVFNGVVVLTKASNSLVRFANSNPDTFNDDVYLSDLSGNNGIDMSYAAAGNQFNGELNLNIDQTGSITFGLNGGTSTLSSGNDIGIFNTGLASGSVSLSRLTQLGAGLISFVQSTGSGQLNFSECIFNANLNITVPGFTLARSTFNGDVAFSKVGTGDRISAGGNVFNQGLSLRNSVSGSLTMAQTIRDIYNGNLTIDQSGNSFIQMANASAGNIFNGTITLNSSGNSLGVRFGQGAGTSTFTALSRPEVGVLGFARGELGFRWITVEGSNPFALDIATGTTSGIIADAVINCPLELNIPRLVFARNTFNGAVSIRKNSAGNDLWTGGSVFNGLVNIQITNGYLYTGTSLPETFNGTARIYCSGNGRAYLSNGVAGSLFSGDLTLIAENSNSMILFGQSGGTTTLGSGALLTVTDGINSQGSIRFRNFTQAGSEALDLQMGTSNSSLYFETASTFNGALNAQAGLIYFNGTQFNIGSTFESTGPGTATSLGGNSFANNTTITSSGIGVLVLGNANPDSFLGQLSINASGAGARIQLAQTSSGNVFSGPILLSSINGAGGIRFCNNNGAASLTPGAYFSISGAGFNSGDLNLRRITQTGTDAHTLNLSGTASSVTFLTANTFAGNMSCSAPRVYLNGSTFNGINSFEQTGATNISSTGGNNFQDATQLTLSGNGAWFQSTTSPDIYNSNLTLRVDNSSGILFMAHNVAGTTVNGNIQLVSANGTGGIRFCQGSSGSIALTGSFSIGVGGFNAGDIRIRSTTQSGLSANALVLTGASTSVYFEQVNIFSGNMTCSAPRVYLNGSTFNGINSFEQTGATTINSTGGNNFQGATQLTLSGNGAWFQSTTSPDTYNSNLTLRVDNSSGILYMAHNVAGTTVNGNIQLISANGTGGIRFCQGSSGSIALTGSFSIGAGGFNAGDIRIRSTTQSGLSANALVLTGASTSVYFEQVNIFTGNMTCSAPRVFLNGSRFDGTNSFEQTGATNISSTGGNNFQGATQLTLSGNGAWFQSTTSPDTYNSNLTLRVDNSSGILYMAHNVAGTTVNGNIQLISTNGTGGIRFGQGANGSLSLTGSFSLGAGGFNAGDIRIRRTTQSGLSANSLILTGSATTIYFEQLNTFAASMTATASSLFLNGSQFAGATFTQNGSLNTVSNGGNSFSGPVALNLSGSGYFMLGNTSPDVFSSSLAATNTSTSILYLAHRAIDNQFNGNVTLISTGSSQGVYFGQANGTSTLASGATFAYGGSGFTNGGLRIRNLVQSGSAAISLSSASTTAQVYLETGTSFSGNVTISSANLFLNGATFNGTANLTNSGTAAIGSAGGNTFNGSATVLCTGAGEWRLASTTSDVYNGDVVFRSTLANRLFVAYGSAVNFNRNISTIGSTFAITFAPANNSGWVVFGGALAQTISADAARIPVIPNLMINKSANGLTLNNQVTVTRNLAFVSGLITSSASNLLVMEDNALMTGASSLSYINGPVRKVGNDAFTFPTGKNGIYRPISISAPSNTTHHFTAELFRGTSSGSYSHASKVASIQTISQCEYWILNRTNGTSNVNVTLGWNGFDCLVTNPSTLVVARWNGTSWQNHGNGGTTGSAASGSVASSAAITSFSPFAVASTSIENPLPVELISFNGEVQSGIVKLKWETASETNSHYFEIEKSTDLVNFTSIGKVTSAGTTTQHSYYDLIDHEPFEGVSYYRLIQVDFNGSTTVYDPISINNVESSELKWNIWPNPSEGVINLSLSNKIDAKECDVTIINSLGNIVKTMKIDPNNKIQLDMEDLPVGVYSILITGNNIRFSSKIIKK